ncbi:MAG: ADP-ribosylglycohydrolase family protein [Ruminococcus sp.]|nr:ADP-ribosylglycohydrolase family protein [Ruminococcus sp.]
MNTNLIRDRIRGSLIGGAVGDALGYPVEFMNEEHIYKKYGNTGIEYYDVDRSRGVAVVSDDTQMTLFTANALLFGAYRQRERGISAEPRHYALYAYLGWLHTQQFSYSDENRIPEDWRGWASYLLKDVPELYVRRAPGNTCLDGLKRRKEKVDNNIHISDYIADKINDSKGCGGIMRVAPLGLAMRFCKMDRLDMEGAQLAAITHSHPLGYMPAAVLTHILNRLVCCEGDTDLKAIILESKSFVNNLFAENPYISELNDIIDKAILLSDNNDSDTANISKLGEGWVAEEALAISLYCSLKYNDNFSKSVIASVNHKGDSDSTGAITGNIMGALLGYERIEQKWLSSLEMHDLILQIADKLYSDFA